MSIATALTALADDVSAAKAAITAKGGTAPNGTADMADAIAAIPTGGGSIFKESGEIVLHSGRYSVYTISIPISDATKTHYLVITKAKNLWFKVDGVWVERDGLDATGYISGGQYLTIGAFAVYPEPETNTLENNDGTIAPKKYSCAGRTVTLKGTSVAASLPGTTSVLVENNSIKLTSEREWEKSDVGCTHEYTVIGWD